MTIARRIRDVLAAVMVLAIAPLAGHGEPVGSGSDTSSVQVTITVLPFAEVTLSVPSVQVGLVPNQTTTVEVEGTVKTNTPVSLHANVTPPADVDSENTTWSATPEAVQTLSSGTYTYGNLLRIQVVVGSDYYGPSSYELVVAGQSAGNVSEIPVPDAGSATLTVVPDGQ